MTIQSDSLSHSDVFGRAMANHFAENRGYRTLNLEAELFSERTSGFEFRVEQLVLFEQLVLCGIRFTIGSPHPPTLSSNSTKVYTQIWSVQV